MAPLSDRVPRRRRRRPGDAAVRPPARPRALADRRRLAHRRGGRRTRPASRDASLDGRHRLVVGVRLLRGRPVVARRRVPGGSRAIRLGAALRRARPAGGARLLSGLRVRPRPLHLVAGRRTHLRPRLRADRQRVAARNPVHRLSLEHARHGPCPERLAHAGRIAGRAVRPDGARRSHLRGAGDPRHRIGSPGAAPARRRRRWRRWPPSRCSEPAGFRPLRSTASPG